MIPPNDDELTPIGSSIDDRVSDESGFEDHAFEVLVEEAVGGRGPQDLTQSILKSLQVGSIIQPIPASNRSRGSHIGSKGPKFSTWGYATLTIAASGLLVLGIWATRHQDKTENNQTIASINDTPTIQKPSVPVLSQESDKIDQPATIKKQKQPKTLPQPIEFASDSSEAMTDNEKINSAATHVPVPPLRPLTLVSEQLSQSVEMYWKSIDVQPTSQADARKWRDRWTKTIGVPSEAAQSVDPDQLEDVIRWVSQPEITTKFAEQWLKTIFGKSLSKVSQEDRLVMQSEIADSISGKNKLSTVVQNWTTDPKHPFRAANGQVVGDQRVSVIRVAALTLAADLRCSGCHDGLVDRRISQADHWSIASVIANTNKDIFYETIDGRSRLAEKKMPAPFSNASRSLAAGAIHTLWTTAFKRPPAGSVVDFEAIVDDPALQTLRTTLIDDLLSSDFNLARSIALMITSPAGRRTVPEIYQDGSWATADRSTAERQIDAFAAAPPIAKLSDISQRVTFNLEAIGRKLDSSVNRSLLGQIDDRGKKEPYSKSAPSEPQSLEFTWDYPDSFTVMPATWLETIKDDAERIRHIAYLGGQSELPAEVADAATEMKKANIDENLRLNRVWWMMQ